MSVETPPPSAALVDAIAKMGPVRTRVPGRALAVVLAISFASVAMMLAFLSMRPDRATVPRGWWLALAALWAGGFVAPIAAAIYPRRGSVLPDQPRAHRLALAFACVLVAAMFAWPVGAALPDAHASMRAGAACFAAGLGVALVPAIATLWALRGVVQVGRWRLGAAIGAGSAALGGLFLHCHCGFGGLHPGLAHGAAVVAGAFLGAFAAPRVLR